LIENTTRWMRSPVASHALGCEIVAPAAGSLKETVGAAWAVEGTIEGAAAASAIAASARGVLWNVIETSRFLGLGNTSCAWLEHEPCHRIDYKEKQPVNDKSVGLAATAL
jgi:hypothetical protein